MADKRCHSGSESEIQKYLKNSIETDKDGFIECHKYQQLDEYECESIIGDGSYGHVLHAIHSTTSQHVAIKTFRNDEKDRKVAEKEIFALTTLSLKDPEDKSSCIKMIKTFSYGGHICIVFPMLGVSVLDFLEENESQPFSLDHVRHISYQLCHAVQFLHRNGMTHTDVKSENILFVDSSYETIDRGRNLEYRQLYCTDIRLIDFGGLVLPEHKSRSVVTTTTRYYKAPEKTLELIMGQPYDVWSTGCILLEMYFGKILFPAADDFELLAMIEKCLGEIPLRMLNETQTTFFSNGKLTFNWNQATEKSREHCRPLKEFQLSECEDDNDLFEVIAKMLELEPAHRISLDEAMLQPFFDKLPLHQRL